MNYRHGTKIWESQRTTSVNIDWNIRNGVVKHCVSIKQATFLLLLENQHIRIKSLKTKVQKIRAKKTSWLLKHVCVDLISWNCFRQTAVMWERRRVSSRGGKRKRCIVVSARSFDVMKVRRHYEVTDSFKQQKTSWNLRLREFKPPTGKVWLVFVGFLWRLVAKIEKEM